MVTHLHALSHALGLDIYGEHESVKALGILLTIYNGLPTGSCCAIGGLAVVAHTSRAKRQISPDLDLLVDAKYLPRIAKLVPVTASLLGLSVLGSSIAIDIIATHDQVTADALQSSEIINLGGTLLRVVTKDYLCALKFLSGRDKDMSDIALLLQSDATNDSVSLQTQVRTILQRCASEAVEDFDNWLSAFNDGVRF